MKHPDLTEFEAVCPPEESKSEISTKSTDELVTDVRSATFGLQHQGTETNDGWLHREDCRVCEALAELARRVEHADKLRAALQRIVGLANSPTVPRSDVGDFAVEIARAALDSKKPNMVRDPGYELPDAGLNTRKW